MKGRSISQQRIARDLGVSQALVSLVLNGKRENISEESYRRIWDYAVKKGYRPKGMRAVQQATHVGFILRAGLSLYTQSNFFSHVQHGLHEALHEHGMRTEFLGSEDRLNEPNLQQKLEQRRLSGIVVMGEVDAAFIKKLARMHSHVVAVSASYPGICSSVMPNDAQSLEQLVEHLAELGHRRFAWLGGNKQLRQNVIRRNALEDALESRRLDLDAADAVDLAGGDRIQGREAAAQLLARRPKRTVPTAWVCLNGLMARGAINYLMQTGWRVPEEISVVAVDATRVCEEEHPLITGANSDPELMGRKAAELLMQFNDNSNGSYSDVMLSSHLTVRESSAKCPV